MPTPSTLLLGVIGLFAGMLSGVFGIGGGIVIVPALIYLAGFRQHLAIGTSLAVLLPPVGAAAALEYYRHGNVDVRAAVVLAVTVAGGGWAGARVANRLSGPQLQLAFALFVMSLGVYLIFGAIHRLGWI